MTPGIGTDFLGWLSRYGLGWKPRLITNNERDFKGFRCFEIVTCPDMTSALREPLNGGALVVDGLRKRFGEVEVLAGIDTRLNLLARDLDFVEVKR